MKHILIIAYIAFVISKEYPIKNVVVLMMENHSFDHMLGWMTKGGAFGNTQVEGLTGKECNSYLTSTICVNDQAEDVPTYDPNHSHQSTTERIFDCTYSQINIESGDSPCINHASYNGHPSMKGFLMSAIKNFHNGKVEFTMLSPEKVPIITTLANQFALFDNYFSSYPGPTNPNRLFVHTGTCDGCAGNEQVKGEIKSKTIQEVLQDRGYTWRYYYEDNPNDWFLFISYFNDNFENPDLFRQMELFYQDAANGDLPSYTFINPTETYNPDLKDAKSYGLQNDQHPKHSIKEGERLIKNVYEALRNGPLWNQTLLIINYDEHGGFYDHVPPPQGQYVPNPDGKKNYRGFDFKRIGIRVPMLLISPWIEKRTLIKAPKDHQKPHPTSEFEHSSVISTIQKIFGIEDEYLTDRVSWAATFDDLLLIRNTPRTDCPTRLPDVPPPTQEEIHIMAQAQLKENQLKQIYHFCNILEPDNDDCGRDVDTAIEFWQFIKERQQKYHQMIQ